ncbi:DUF4365 domain-containing protein [Burkholderia ambifaria]|uniref:DUF4365 domain-containing protein n=1 Tax=Burkholderia ambifaria TaxID=152480 RepID=UPI00158A6204|nr:DUF4365 domain-containing protein [Burkholderia ambifaria]
MTTQRVRNHELEDRSLAALRLAVPPKWVIHDFRRDYGIDVQLELFDANGFATGLRCYGQLKATDNAEDEDKLSLDRDHFEYWSSHTDPVLLLRYYEETQTIHWCWLHEIAWSLKPNADSLSVVRFLRAWDRVASPKEILDFLTKRSEVVASRLLPPFAVSIVSASLDAPALVALAEGVANSVSGKSFEVFSGDRPDAVLKVFVENSAVATTHLGLPGFAVSLDVADPDINALIWLLIFLTACRYDRILAGRPLAKRHLPLLMKGATGSLLAPTADAIAYALGVEEAADKLELFKPVASIDAQIKHGVVFGVLFSAAHRYGQADEWVDLLHHARGSSEDRKQNASISYSLANALAATGRWDEAVDAFRSASDYDDDYLLRPYFHHELATALFESRDYVGAVAQCKRALEIEDDLRTRYLLGDALFCMGEFSLSLCELESVMERDLGTDSLPHAALLVVLCFDLVERWHIENGGAENNQYAGEVDALEALATRQAGDFDSMYCSLLAAHSRDGLFHFNIGHTCIVAGNYRAAALRYFHCGLLQRSDAEAWALGIGCATKAGDIPLTALGMSVGYSLCGESVIHEYLQHCRPSAMQPLELQKWQQESIDAFRKMRRDARHPLTVRLWGTDATHGIQLSM